MRTWLDDNDTTIYLVLSSGVGLQGRRRPRCHGNKDEDPGDYKVHHGRETRPSHHQPPRALQETVPRAGGGVLRASL